jgi:hypothetical protein
MEQELAMIKGKLDIIDEHLSNGINNRMLRLQQRCLIEKQLELEDKIARCKSCELDEATQSYICGVCKEHRAE